MAAAAKLISQLHGFTRNEVKLMEIAGNLHDIGKMAVPNRILEKPGKLDDDEMAVMKAHTYNSYEVINSIDGMQQIAEWAAFHHEKLDGSGYPFHRDRDSLNLGARIMSVADVFTALTEERPLPRVPGQGQGHGHFDRHGPGGSLGPGSSWIWWGTTLTTYPSAWPASRPRPASSTRTNSPKVPHGGKTMTPPGKFGGSSFIRAVVAGPMHGSPKRRPPWMK